ncbi:MAG TPA: AsmA-like C-terminal region-containing protein, partial [Hyphomicrobiaceae bacterium]|nr:AsmA-like C-terminal region-containing protein [Hyphomicrobiaceae bacterium]
MPKTRSQRVTARGGRSRPWGRALSFAAKALGIPAFAVALTMGLLYVKLLHGAISLDFLIQPIEKAVAEEAAGLRVRVEAVVLRLADGGRLEFELKNVRFADAADTPLVVAPSAAISLSRSALLRGRIAPESVDLVSPRLSLFYSDDGVLSLKFATPGEVPEAERTKAAVARGVTEVQASNAGRAEAEGGLGRIDLIKVLSESSARARRREQASAYLRGVGLRSATVVIDNGSRKSIWRVPELDIDLDHRRSRSSIAGRAKIDSLTGPWTINFRTSERENAKALQLAVSVQGLVPRGMARMLPQLSALEAFDVPVWGEAKVDLSNTGEILAGTIGVDAAPGQVTLPGVAMPLRIDGGHLALTYDRANRRFDVAPSVIVWGDSRAQFTGNIVYAQTPEGPGWSFAFNSAGGWIGAEPPALERLNLDDWSMRGVYLPDHGRVSLQQLRVKAGGADVSAEGVVADAAQTRIEGRIGPMPASTFKALWPAVLAPKARDWVVEHVARGMVQGGSFRLGGGDRGSLTLEGSNLAFALVRDWPLLEAPRVLLRFDDRNFELTVPDAAFTARDGRKLAFKGAFTIDMTEPLPRTGKLALRGQGPLALALEMLNAEPLHLLRDTDIAIAGIDGKLDTQLTISMPLGHDLTPADIVVEGKTRIADARGGQVMAPYEVQGANIVVDMTPTSAEAKADMLINGGVTAKAMWQHVFGVPADKQPPLRISAVLDNSYRNQLGLDINDIVQGDVGVDVTLSKDARGEKRIHLRADLLNAEVVLDSVAWRKPKGRASVFEADVVRGGATYPVELHNVRLVGDNAAIEGWMGIGADNKLKEFRFPNFSLNVVTSLETSGKVRPDGVWDVTAKGQTYDGRDLFRSFFDVAHLGDPNAKVRPGLDLNAQIGTVIGFSDTTLRNVKMQLQKRSNKLVWMDARGVLEGGKPFAAEVRSEAGQNRRLRAEAMDAGQLFKLVGFYPNAVGGALNLEVNLEGRGAAERTGTLWVRDFLVLGDPILTEVLQNSDGTPGKRRTVMREQFDFDIMRVPFSVGHGQFVMHDSIVNGPIVSASMRGKVDFRAQMLDVGGTYVPMSGLMQAPSQIPILGPVLTGPRGEGLFGMTFAIQGPMAKPEVLVNPLSLITPGIFREIFQMTPD